MSNYAFVENNNISKHFDLPNNWKNVSGFNLSKNDEAFLNSFGWYTVQKQQVTLKPNEEIIDYTLTFENNKVVGIPVVRDNTTIENFSEKKQNFLRILRETRNQYLTRCDWTQAEDVKEEHTIEWISAWKDYRKKLRDLPTEYENNNVISMYDVEWPQQPSV